MPVVDDPLERALSRGALGDLPDNVPPGVLGEVAPDFRKADLFEPSLNAGLLQESTSDTRWLTIVVLYLIVLTFPVALWLLWRDRRRSLRAKVITTLVGVVGYVALYVSTALLRT